MSDVPSLPFSKTFFCVCWEAISKQLITITIIIMKRKIKDYIDHI